MLRAEFEAEDEYDTYDPFGAIDQEGNDAVPDPKLPMLAVTAVTSDVRAVEPEATNGNNAEGVGDITEEISHDIMHRFANYGWKQEGQLPDPELQATWPDGRDIKKFGKISITKVTAPCKGKGDKAQHNASKLCSRFQSRNEWWEPVVWWLSNTKWTASGLGNNCTVNKNHMLATWVELALVFQIQTGVRLAPDSLDLRSQETIFRSIVKRIWSKTVFTI
jgi:hypothetical protein